MLMFWHRFLWRPRFWHPYSEPVQPIVVVPHPNVFVPIKGHGCRCGTACKCGPLCRC